MKKIVPIITLVMLLLTGLQKTNAQTCILNMTDQFGPNVCGWHCWARATKNVLYYYGNTSITNLEIIDYARTEKFLDDCENCENYACDVCSVTPDTCCKTLNLDGIDDILYYFGAIKCNVDNSEINQNSQFLFNQFILNKPVIIKTTGHVFAAYGINGSSVYALEAGDAVIRSIYDICPGRTWSGTFIMNHNRNCSYTNNISNVLYTGCTYTASNTVTLSNSILYHAGYTTTLQAENKVQLCEGVKIRKNSALVIQTGYNFCP